MNKKGFVFIEMIVTTVVLIVALLVLYATYSKIISNEKQRLYYDDIAYVYKAEKIRDVVANSVDYNNFYQEINNNVNGYVYLFGPDSDIWQSNKTTTIAGGTPTTYTNFRLLWNEYSVNAIGYVSINDIKTLKKCFNLTAAQVSSPNNESQTNLTDAEFAKCLITKNHLSAYSKTTIENYLKTIDVDYASATGIYGDAANTHQAIFIVMFGEAKNGDKISNALTYSKCIQEKAYANYQSEGNALCQRDYEHKSTNKPDCNNTNTKKVYAVKAYNKDDKTSYDMACENGYNIVWVYF